MKRQITASLLLLFFCSISTAQVAKPKAFSTAGKKVTVYTTAENTGLKLSANGTAEFKAMGQPFETQVCVFVDPNKTYQTFLGIGGALTDAAAETWAKLPAAKQEELLKAYFNKTAGIGYTVGRTNIASCDFSSSSYMYVQENDKELNTFDIAPDRKFKIPFIKAAMAAAGGKLNLFASPWSPPAFMKDNNDILQGGHLKKDYYASWANHFVKFIKAYEKEGMPVWAISIQNEPMAKQRWESCIYSAEEERDFLKNNLGPTMEKAGLKSRKIIVWDHNRDLMFQRAQTYFDDPQASRYAWGIGFHWYENWSGGEPMYENVKRVHEAYPDKNILFTEGCVERFEMSRVNDWKLGERYGKSMINDFNNGMGGFTDWNILLDETGGPNHVGNFCFAPVHADTKTGELIYTNAYYYIGQFSKYIQPGAKRITSAASRSQLLTTAFRNPDGTTVVVVMNQSDAATPYYLWIKGKAAELNALPHSISTLLF
ncbi:MAG: glycoside hydrolase family 30 protein [Chitinophagaceae bacterium]|nr:glycoside hydrolase family 30 protein [Chitinophagaceae bacterium]